MSFGISVSRAIKDAQVVFTASLDTAAEALSTATLFATGDAPAPAAEATGSAEKNVKAGTAKPSTEKQTQTASDSSANSSTDSPESKTSDEPPTLDYEKDIKPLVLSIAKINREKAEGLLQRFGVTSAKSLKAEQFAEFKELADKVIAGEYDPTASNEGVLA